MKCRRNKASRGARLRSARANASPPAPVTDGHRGPTLANTPHESETDNSASVLRIDGLTEGSIHHGGAVAIGPHGAVIGDIYAAEIFVEGAISGNIHATQTLRIACTAKVVGDMQSPRLAVARGAQLRGNIATGSHSTPPSDLDERAVDTLLAGGRLA
jgi:cytoskeletal protein CcmA (bactofilin family)